MFLPLTVGGADFRRKVMSLSSIYKTDNSKETQGVEFTYPPNDDGTIPTFIVSRMAQSNPKYAKALEEAVRPYKHLQRTDQLKGEVATKVVMQAFIKGCLQDWKNVKFADIVGGHNQENAPFNVENATQLFSRLPDLFADLQEQASQIANFREADIEADAKN